MDFDWLYDIEFDTTAALVAIGMAVLMSIFWFGDVLSFGMDSVSLGARVIGVLAGLVVGYFIALKMLNR